MALTGRGRNSHCRARAGRSLGVMRLARFSLNDSPRYAFVQKDETDGKDYLIELDGHPLAGDQVAPTRLMAMASACFLQ